MGSSTGFSWSLDWIAARPRRLCWPHAASSSPLGFLPTSYVGERQLGCGRARLAGGGRQVWRQNPAAWGVVQRRACAAGPVAAASTWTGWTGPSGSTKELGLQAGQKRRGCCPLRSAVVPCNVFHGRRSPPAAACFAGRGGATTNARLPETCQECMFAPYMGQACDWAPENAGNVRGVHVHIGNCPSPKGDHDPPHPHPKRMARKHTHSRISKATQRS